MPVTTVTPVSSTTHNWLVTVIPSWHKEVAVIEMYNSNKIRAFAI